MGCRSHVPGWHVSTLEAQQTGRLQVVGIVQEQHPERARLFMQWKQMDWPVLADPLNLLGVDVVPITLLIDEAGIIRSVNPKPGDLEGFLAQPPPSPLPIPVNARQPDLVSLAAGEDRAAWANAAALWGGEPWLDQAIATYRDLLTASPEDGALQFRAGVLHRLRHDSNRRQPGDFPAAAQHWTRSLELNPNQYIWRRRVQQYGPRLAKPYAFYDWVPEAREAIVARGEMPAALTVEPGGAEFAAPVTALPGGTVDAGREPDPDGRIRRDLEGFIRAEVTVVPAQVKPGGAVRVHVTWRPETRLKAHWNNEVNGLVLRMNPPAGWTIDPVQQELPLPETAVSNEARSAEFEIVTPSDASGDAEIPGYALYYVCEDTNGTCLYRRQDLELSISIRP
ncbi:MAG TPA: hypothetical protein DCY13_22795 [Verrucomicrobiales bacterium]|nr:hypothetical protein [Verrucomicrobiales bacterium]